MKHKIFMKLSRKLLLICGLFLLISCGPGSSNTSSGDNPSTSNNTISSTTSTISSETFSIEKQILGNGNITLSSEKAKEGDKISIQIIPEDKASKLKSLSSPQNLVFTKVDDKNYTFVMPKMAVKIISEFEAIKYQISSIDFPSYSGQIHNIEVGNQYDAKSTVTFNVTITDRSSYYFNFFVNGVQSSIAKHADFYAVSFVMPTEDAIITSQFSLFKESDYGYELLSNDTDKYEFLVDDGHKFVDGYSTIAVKLLEDDLYFNLADVDIYSASNKKIKGAVTDIEPLKDNSFILTLQLDSLLDDFYIDIDVHKATETHSFGFTKESLALLDIKASVFPSKVIEGKSYLLELVALDGQIYKITETTTNNDLYAMSSYEYSMFQYRGSGADEIYKISKVSNQVVNVVGDNIKSTTFVNCLGEESDKFNAKLGESFKVIITPEDGYGIFEYTVTDDDSFPSNQKSAMILTPECTLDLFSGFGTMTITVKTYKTILLTITPKEGSSNLIHSYNPCYIPANTADYSLYIVFDDIATNVKLFNGTNEIAITPNKFAPTHFNYVLTTSDKDMSLTFSCSINANTIVIPYTISDEIKSNFYLLSQTDMNIGYHDDKNFYFASRDKSSIGSDRILLISKDQETTIIPSCIANSSSSPQQLEYNLSKYEQVEYSFDLTNFGIDKIKELSFEVGEEPKPMTIEIVNNTSSSYKILTSRGFATGTKIEYNSSDYNARINFTTVLTTGFYQLTFTYKDGTTSVKTLESNIAIIYISNVVKIEINVITDNIGINISLDTSAIDTSNYYIRAQALSTTNYVYFSLPMVGIMDNSYSFFIAMEDLIGNKVVFVMEYKLDYGMIYNGGSNYQIYDLKLDSDFKISITEISA